MRQGRLKVPLSYPVGYYHCMSRVVDRQFILTDTEKEAFYSLMRQVELFCAVHVLTLAFMDNHFHLVVEVPRRPEIMFTAEELIARLEQLPKPPNLQRIKRRIAFYRSHHDSEGERAYLASFWVRMWDISQFMKELKQRYTQGYNQRHGRKGTLWEERFKSVVVEGDQRALLLTALYVDLNSVRAGKATDPKDYRWSGYGRAVGGDSRALQGICRLIESTTRRPGLSSSEALREYRMALYRTGDERREALDHQGHRLRKGLKTEAVLEVLRNQGQLDFIDYVSCRIRYLSDGAILGSRNFLETLIAGNRRRLGVRVQSRKPERMEGLREELYSLRWLSRKEKFG